MYDLVRSWCKTAALDDQNGISNWISSPSENAVAPHCSMSAWCLILFYNQISNLEVWIVIRLSAEKNSQLNLQI